MHLEVSDHDPDLSIVVPTYRSAQVLEELVDRVATTLGRMGLSWEMILVHDASPDETWDVIERLCEHHAEVVGIDLLHNHGQPTATMCGLAHASGRLVATMDDDLQHPPEELPTLVEALRAHPEWDAVVGTWPLDQGVLRDIGSRVHAWSDRIAHGSPPGFHFTAFRVMRRAVVDAMVANQTRTPAIGPLLTRTTNRVVNVPVRHAERASGASNFRMRHGVSAVTANFAQGSTLPLRVMSWFGLGVASLAFLLAFVLLVRYLLGVATAPGWLSVFLATLFFGGMVLVQVGLLGQYVHLIVREVRQPPRWGIRRTVHGHARPLGDDSADR